MLHLPQQGSEAVNENEDPKFQSVAADAISETVVAWYVIVAGLLVCQSFGISVIFR